MLLGAAAVVTYGSFLLLGGVVPAVAGFDGGLVAAAVVAVPALIAVELIVRTIEAVAKAALYVYATEGRKPAAFDHVEFSGPAG